MRLFKNTFFVLIILTLLGGFLRFYNLNWGAPYYSHPDERNIAYSVTRLRFPDKMNPEFFAYGSLPIYTIYASGVIKNILATKEKTWDLVNTVKFEDAIIISRFFSALFSTLLILLLYKIGNQIHSKRTGIITAFLGMTSVGFIQYAHFGTFEMWLTLFTTLLLWSCMQIKKDCHLFPIITAGITYGILVSIKVSSVVLIFLPALGIIRSFSSEFLHSKMIMQKAKVSFSLILNILAVLLIASIVFIATNPYSFLDFTAFKGSITYESDVALGKTPVFYTQAFAATIPILFQLLHVYPFLMNPLMVGIFLLSFIYMLWQIMQKKLLSYMFLLFFFLTTFLSQAFFFVKWIRYMVPTLPFMYLIIAIGIADLLHLRKRSVHQSLLTNIGFYLMISICSLFALAYFLGVLTRIDTRVAAKDWAKVSIPNDAKILSETFDLGIVPFNENFHNITLFNFYELDNNSPEFNKLNLGITLNTYDYIIIPSSRIFTSRILSKDSFTYGHIFYTELFSKKLGYNMIYATPCDIFCKILYLGNPDFSFEQTANVFDRPTLYIFKKNL